MSDTLTPRTDEALDSIKLRLRGISILDTFTIRDLLSEANGLKEQLNVACTDAAFLDSYHKKATSGGAK